MAEEKELGRYREKRNFGRTPEPDGNGTGQHQQIFVVQKHDSRRLHYDFRIEVNGVLASWAVPKGPSVNPAEKRLAVRTEDHPISYADFEGVIPEGEYGAGAVIVWDKGTYRNIKHVAGEELSVADSLERGQVEIQLEGEKLKGGFALIKTKWRGKDNWLLIKMKDEHADAGCDIVSVAPNSVISGLSVEETAQQSDPGDKCL